MAVAASATPKMIVTIRPEVVSSSSLFMQTSAPAVAEKHIIPGAQEAISVVVATQVEVPDVVWQLEVDFVDVTEQVPVVVAPEVVDPVLVVVVLDEVEVVDEAVVAVEEVESDVVESAVVVADVLATVVLDVFALVDFAEVVFAVVFAVVLSAVVLSSVVESALLLKSPLPLSNGWQSFANQTASTVAAPTPHPFEL
jgi:hypothetical protein